MRESVKNLRDSKCSTVDNCPGYYFWWFREDCVKKLLAPLPGVDYSRLISDRNGYVALYVGIVEKEKRTLRQRALWHICDDHSASKVKAGTLSTLRQTISALLGIDMTKSKQAVNDFMDDNCEWEWFPTKSGEEAKAKEKEELSKHYYPLNIKANKVVNKDTKNALKKLRKDFKK